MNRPQQITACLIFLLFCFMCFSGTAQSPVGQKGAGAIVSKGFGFQGETRAVVIGISDYQDDRIPDLRFADRDARVFAGYLQSPAGGQLDEDHLKILTNERATFAQMVAALDWLIDESEAGDQAIIYFSGHGDVEIKTRSQWGFLLPWDAPPQTYILGAYPVYYLQDIISTLSIEKECRVILITDACRSGKLAGSKVGGTEVTNHNLSRQFANELKILSCQPNEYSIEGEQWGGGRGAFSYFLVNGLYGLADEDADGFVSLKEIDRYLEDNVPEEVAPLRQTPLVNGDRYEKLVAVDEEMKKELETQTPGELLALSVVESRGIEEEILAGVDSLTRERYLRFKKALKEGHFFDPPGESADQLYAQLVKEEQLARLHNHMKRNYAAALQDEAQQFMNAIMTTDEDELNFRIFLERERFVKYPPYLARAAELLGSDHYMYRNLKAKEYQFLAGVSFIRNPFKQDSAVGMETLRWCDRVLEMEPQMIAPFFIKSLAFATNLGQPDSAAFYSAKAMELAPTWVLPYQSLADLYLIIGDQEQAGFFMEKAWAIDSASILMLNTRGKVKSAMGDFDEAERCLLKAIDLEPDFAALYRELADIYLRSFRFELGHQMLLKAVELDPKEIWAIKKLGYYHLSRGEYEQALARFERAVELDVEKVCFVNFDLACYYSTTGNAEKAFGFLEKTLENGFPFYQRLANMPFLRQLREQPEQWEALMQKYFPGRNP